MSRSDTSLAAGLATRPGAPRAEQSSSSEPAPGDAAIKTLQTALATEQAALWSYGLVTAYNPKAKADVSRMVQEHQVTNNVAVDLLTQSGVTPQEPAPAYSTPFKVTDAPSAIRLALAIESDCAAAWRSVIGHTNDATLRGTALSALTQCALRMVTWRQAAGEKDLTVPFPGVADAEMTPPS